MSGWENVTRRRPCAICGRADWCRFTTDDKLEDCYRLGDANSVEHQDINGATATCAGFAGCRKALR